MEEKQEKPKHQLDPNVYFYIDTKTPTNPRGRDDFQYIDITASPTYKELLRREKERTLVDLYPRLDFRVASKAANFHDSEMLNEEGVLKYESCGQGLIPVPIAEKEECEKLLKMLQKIDKDVKLWDLSKKFEDVPNTKKSK